MNNSISTSDGFPDKTILESLGPVSANTVIGMNLFKDFLSSITDIVGGESSSYRNTFDESVDIAIKRLQKKASLLGANGIVSLRIDTSEISGKGKSMVMVTVYGTAVLLDDVTHSIEESQRIIFLKITNILNELSYNSLSNDELLDELRIEYNLTSEEFLNSFSSLIEERKKTFKREPAIGVKKEELSEEARLLVDEMNGNEMLVKMDDDGSLKVINKEQYELETELRLKRNYSVVFKN